MTKLEHALAAARRGFDVFPLIPNAKLPLIAKWPDLATSDDMQIREWWHDTPDANIGICTNRLLVVDVDPRNGGAESVAALKLIEGIPPTLASHTQGGGNHLVYRMPEHVFVSNDTTGVPLGKGIDIKGFHGYIVAPGSTIDKRPYRWLNDCPPTEAPQWLIDRCKVPRKRAAKGKPLVTEDEIACKNAWDWLVNHAPDAVEGERDNTAFKIACRMYENGITQGTCEEFLTEWNRARCFPSLPETDIARLAASALEHMHKPQGIRHPLNNKGLKVTEIAERPKPAPIERPQFYLVRADEAAREAMKQPGDPLIKGVIDRGTMSTLIGAPGAGKTFIALDFNYHVAKGADWCGHKVRQGAAVYLAAEAGPTIKLRVRALEARYGALGALPLYIIPCGADFAHGPEDATALVKLMLEFERDSGIKIELFTVDTLSRTLSGGDENGPKDMGAFVQAVDFIREQVRTHAMVVHHFGKDESRGGRGHTILKGAVDTEMQVSGHVLRFEKQRDMEEGPDMPFKLRPLQIGTDAEGVAVTSCTVHMLGKNEVADKDDLTRLQIDIIETLQDALSETPDEKFTAQYVVRLMKKEYSATSDASFSDSCARSEKEAMRQQLDAAQDLGWIKKLRPNQYVMGPNARRKDAQETQESNPATRKQESAPLRRGGSLAQPTLSS